MAPYPKQKYIISNKFRIWSLDSCTIRIDKNILGINGLFFYENQKFRPQGGPFVYISDFSEGVKVKFFRFILKQIHYFVTLNTLVLESIKISWELLYIIYSPLPLLSLCPNEVILTLDAFPYLTLN